MESEYWVHTENTISDGTERWQEQYKQIWLYRPEVELLWKRSELCKWGFWGSKGNSSETDICIKSFSQDAVVYVCATWILGSESQ